MKNEFGVHLKNSTEIDLLHSYIDRVCQFGDATLFSQWPQDKRSELQQGVPTAAKHIVVHGEWADGSCCCDSISHRGWQRTSWI